MQDLTPAATHLIVGDYDTPKYRHVARERPDVCPMDATWIDAIISLWMKDEHINFRKLENEHRLKALELRGANLAATQNPQGRDSLLICLTGFGDQRDEIAETVAANGGRYSGDLTRKCTHLIVSKPEGKKFTAAKSWGVKTVTLEWLKRSVERGMILDEEKFDPLLPAEEQGVGAWTKRDRHSLGKRSRSDVPNAPEEGTRKLRKTASMRLNNQRDNMWGDILGRPDSRANSFANSFSNQPADGSFKQADPKPESREVKRPTPPKEDEGIFSSSILYIHGFNSKKRDVLAQTITTLGGTIASSLKDAASSSPSDKSWRRILIVPQASKPDTHPQPPNDSISTVTEFYIERCLHNKRFFEPREHVLGRPFAAFPISGFADLTVCSAAFTGIELSQVSRAVAQLGARYDEQFRKTSSVLICKSLPAMRKEKLKLALSWGVPVVSADWLWECILTGSNVSFDDFVFPELRKYYQQDQKAELPDQSTKRPLQRNHSDPAPGDTKSNPLPRSLTTGGIDASVFDSVSGPKDAKRRTILRHEPTTSADFQTARTQLVDAPLTERSSASLNKAPSPAKPASSHSKPDTRQTSAEAGAAAPDYQDPGHGDGDNDDDDDDGHDSASKREDEAAEAKERLAKAAERQALSSKLTTLLDATSPAPDTTADAGPRPRKRQIMGRAISNASAASSGNSAALPFNTSVDGGGGGGGTGGADEADGDEDRAENNAPPATQLGYHIAQSRDNKAELLRQMMGDVEGAAAAVASELPPAPATERKSVAVEVAGAGRNMRRR